MERADLHANIGELTVQLDHVAKKSKQLGVWSELPSLSKLSVRTQCSLLGVSRSSISYKPVVSKPQEKQLHRILDGIYLRDPCLVHAGSSQCWGAITASHSTVKSSSACDGRWAWRPSTASRARASRTRRTAFIPVCCASWRSRVPIKCGAPTFASHRLTAGYLVPRLLCAVAAGSHLIVRGDGLSFVHQAPQLGFALTVEEHQIRGHLPA